jgi:hypothetical protein
MPPGTVLFARSAAFATSRRSAPSRSDLTHQRVPLPSVVEATSGDSLLDVWLLAPQPANTSMDARREIRDVRRMRESAARPLYGVARSTAPSVAVRDRSRPRVPHEWCLCLPATRGLPIAPAIPEFGVGAGALVSPDRLAQRQDSCGLAGIFGVVSRLARERLTFAASGPGATWPLISLFCASSAHFAASEYASACIGAARPIYLELGTHSCVHVWCVRRRPAAEGWTSKLRTVGRPSTHVSRCQARELQAKRVLSGEIG